jgi:hypothetical protein
MKEQFAQHVSAVSALGEALDGTPAKRKRSASAGKPAAAPAVGMSYACARCGHRTDDQRGYMIHLRTEIGELENELVGFREGSPELFREVRRAYERARYAADPEERRRRAERGRLHRAKPEEKARVSAYNRAYHARRATPECRERENELRRERRARKKAEREASSKGATP